MHTPMSNYCDSREKKKKEKLRDKTDHFYDFPPSKCPANGFASGGKFVDLCKGRPRSAQNTIYQISHEHYVERTYVHASKHVV